MTASRENSLLALLFTGLFFCCVPAKEFELLESKNIKCEDDNAKLKAENKDLTVKVTEFESENSRLKKEIDTLIKDSTDHSFTIRKLKKDYKNLELNYGSLKKTQEALFEGNVEETRRILEELQSAQTNLVKREDRLNILEDDVYAKQRSLEALKKELEQRNARLIEMESILNKKDSVVKALKGKVSSALLGFENNGLSVTIRNGKVYVSLDEQLLFKSGSTAVDPKGISALKKLVKVLEQNAEINIMVEGHTDDVPYISTEAIKDNWDLSVKRATAIVRILLEGSTIEPKRIIASGRSKYAPVDHGKTAEARQKNRRTEIILTPKLDELFQILESN